MKTMKKVSAFLLMVVLCMSVMVMPAFAASTSQDGLEVTLTTDKETYAKGEQIEATLTVTNTNDFAVSNVSLKNMIPDGYKLAEGSTATKQVESLGAGEEVSLTVTYVAEDSDNNEDKPGSGDNTGDTDKPGSGNNNDSGDDGLSGNSSNDNVDVPHTGDDSNIGFWAALMVVSAIAFIALTVRKKRQGHRFLSLLVCFAMVGTIFLRGALPVNAAEVVTEKEFQITENVTIDGSEIEINAVVKYALNSSEAGKSYTVTFYMNDGTDAVYTVTSVAAGNSVTEPTCPTRDGYNFSGWYIDGALTDPFDFATAVTANITLYAKWMSQAEAYYTENSELIEIVKVDESEDILDETAVKDLLDSRGLGDFAISYEYSLTGDKVEETEITDGSDAQHPMYQTAYMSASGELWIIYVINDSIFAYPISFGLESDLGAELIFSESNILTSYDNVTNQFFVTMPHASEMIVETVETIDAETLDNLTTEEICHLTGATVPVTINEDDFNNLSSSTLFSDVSRVSAAETFTEQYSSDDPFIVVSLGDSYSSGEGIEAFYGQNLPLSEKVKNFDWLAHRSTRSWPGQILVPGMDNATLSSYRVPYGESSNQEIQWYFGAVSGAQTKNFDYNANDDDTKNGQQRKDYNKKDDGIFGATYKGTEWLPNQMDIFDNINELNAVDYVTLTIGGNDVDFTGVITCCIEPTYLEFGNNWILENKLNDLWNNIDSTMADIEQVYEKIHVEVPNAAILVAGYPKLLEKNGKGTIFSKNEATLVNEKVHAFNQKIQELVNEHESDWNTYFVDVETEFDKDGGHQAYSASEWINPIKWLKQGEDLTDGFFGIGLPSAYSIHPNAEGAQAYARCVNAKIEELESKKSHHNVTGLITIADDDTDMTNNLPLEGALVTIEYASFMDFVDTSDAYGQYQLQNIPAGTYRLTVTKDGYIPVTEMIEVPEDASEVIYNIAIEAISDGYGGIGYASGTVYDVGTGRPVQGLTLNVRSGLNHTTGTVLQTLYTDEYGQYITSELEAGNYTIEVVDSRIGIGAEERYTTASFNVKVLGNLTIENQNGYVSNGLVSEQLRVVLTWGSTPNDLDSHMVGPDGAGGMFHEYYPERADGSDTDLDVDDVSSYGPETITIYQEYDGTYVYAVHDYTNRYSDSSNALSNSGAQVNVYRGSQLLMTYNVPTNQDGTLWTVFSYDSTTQRITTINEMSYESSASDVLLPAAVSLDETAESVQNKSEYEEYIAIIVADILSATKESD